MIASRPITGQHDKCSFLQIQTNLLQPLFAIALKFQGFLQSICNHILKYLSNAFAGVIARLPPAFLSPGSIHLALLRGHIELDDISPQVPALLRVKVPPQAQAPVSSFTLQLLNWGQQLFIFGNVLLEPQRHVETIWSFGVFWSYATPIHNYLNACLSFFINNKHHCKNLHWISKKGFVCV